MRLKDAPNFTPVNKKLNFNFDEDTSVKLVSDTRDHCPADRLLVQFDMELDELPMDNSFDKGEGEGDNFSPCRTRSGCVYESGLKRRKFRSYKKSKKSGGGRTRILSGQSGTGSVADCSENGSENSDDNAMGKLTRFRSTLFSKN